MNYEKLPIVNWSKNCHHVYHLAGKKTWLLYLTNENEHHIFPVVMHILIKVC